MGTQLKLKEGVKSYYDNNKIMIDLELQILNLRDIHAHLKTHLCTVIGLSTAVIYIMGWMLDTSILIFVGQDIVWMNTKTPMTPIQADVIFAMTVLQTFLPLETQKATDRPQLQKSLGQGQMRPRMALQITEMLMRAVQVQVAEALDDKVQIVDAVPASTPAQQLSGQRTRWVPTAMVTRMQAARGQQQQQDQQHIVIAPQTARTSSEPPLTEREKKMQEVLTKYKLSLDTAHNDLREVATQSLHAMKR